MMENVTLSKGLPMSSPNVGNGLQIFKYNNSEIQFEWVNGRLMANATLMAKAFGKKPIDITKTESWKELEKVLIEDLKCRSEDIRFTFKGNFSHDRKQGTWIHEELVVHLALNSTKALCRGKRVWRSDFEYTDYLP
jgi:hypothetical protein